MVLNPTSSLIINQSNNQTISQPLFIQHLLKLKLILGTLQHRKPIFFSSVCWVLSPLTQSPFRSSMTHNLPFGFHGGETTHSNTTVLLIPTYQINGIYCLSSSWHFILFLQSNCCKMPSHWSFRYSLLYDINNLKGGLTDLLQKIRLYIWLQGFLLNLTGL